MKGCTGSPDEKGGPSNHKDVVHAHMDWVGRKGSTQHGSELRACAGRTWSRDRTISLFLTWVARYARHEVVLNGSELFAAFGVINAK